MRCALKALTSCILCLLFQFSSKILYPDRQLIFYYILAQPEAVALHRSSKSCFIYLSLPHLILVLSAMYNLAMLRARYGWFAIVCRPSKIVVYERSRPPYGTIQVWLKSLSIVLLIIQLIRHSNTSSYSQSDQWLLCLISIQRWGELDFKFLPSLTHLNIAN